MKLNRRLIVKRIEPRGTQSELINRRTLFRRILPTSRSNPLSVWECISGVVKKSPGKFQIDVLVRKQVAPRLRRVARPAEIVEVLRKLLGELHVSHGDLCAVFVDNKEIRRLNKVYRKKDQATDVLAFPLGDIRGAHGNDRHLGDIVISVPTALRQARRLGVSDKEEFSRLLIHGLLHLLGYRHERVAPEVAQRMRRKEQTLIKLVLGARSMRR